MADIELVVRLDQETLQDLYDSRYVSPHIKEVFRSATRFPKGHGRLIDADAFIAMLENTSKRQNYKKLLIGEFLTVDDVFEAIIGSLQNKGLAENDTPTIIEADKEVQE